MSGRLRILSILTGLLVASQAQALTCRDPAGFEKWLGDVRQEAIAQGIAPQAVDAGLAGVTCFDEGNVHWNGGPLFEYVGAHAPEQKVAMDAVFETLSARTTREQTTLPLHELLRLTNDPERDRENKDLYLFTNAVDAGGGFVGADASASWWHRNFRMYANVQKAAAPGHRVLVIAGAGHTAILKDLLAIDGAREAEDVTGYLRP